MSVSISTASGAQRRLPAHLDVADVAGLDSDGRIVVDHFGALTVPVPTPADYKGGAPFLFGLTLCCNASDKGVEDGVVCRGCYSDADIGSYLFRDEDGSFPGLDPLVGIRVPRDTYGDSLVETADDYEDVTLKWYPSTVSVRCPSTVDLLDLHRRNSCEQVGA